MIIGLLQLHNKFAEENSKIIWSPTDQDKLNSAKSAFIAVTTFIGASLLYIFYDPEEIRNFTNTYLQKLLNGHGLGSPVDILLNGSPANLIRTVFPVALMILGAFLYRRFEMSPMDVIVNNQSMKCDPINNLNIQDFKKSFINTYWCLFAFVIIIISRPFIEANFKIFNGIFFSMPFGFPPNDRTIIFGQNPSISFLSLFTLGLSNIKLLDFNTKFKKDVDEKIKTLSSSRQYVNTLRNAFVLMFVGIIFLIICSISGSMTAVYILVSIIGAMILLLPLVIYLNHIKKYITTDIIYITTDIILTAMESALLMPAIRWDILYLFAKYSVGILSIYYAGMSFMHFQGISPNEPCMSSSTQLSGLYVAFIVMLFIFYFFNTLSSSILTMLITNFMRYLVPPTLFGLSSYLIFITNYFVNLVPKVIIQ